MNSLPRHKKWRKCCRGNKMCQNEFSAAAEKWAKSLPRQKVICPGSCYKPELMLHPPRALTPPRVPPFVPVGGESGLKIEALVPIAPSRLGNRD